MIGEVGKPERVTQERVIALFKALGYRFLGDRSAQADNSNVDEVLLSGWLKKRGYSAQQITRVLQKLRDESRSHARSLYENNRKVYELLRYGVSVQVEHQPSETVWLIDWNDPAANDFAIAEEVTLTGSFERRPDLVLYVNGIALAVIELKSSRVSVGEGIRQILSNQQPEFHEWFFSSVQFTFAGNDAEGLRYGAIGTPEKFWLRWREEGEDVAREGKRDAKHDDALPLDRDLVRLCEKTRFLEMIHAGVLFDGGIKKLPRPHQWFGLKAAQAFVRRGEGGVIWHTQGAGKSLLMVLLAKWILEHDAEARVLVVTDRDELDKQIEGVFESANETMKRARSGQDLLAALQQPTPRLLCSLVHKFGRRAPDGSSPDDFKAFLKELRSDPLKAPGKIFVFVDECHRTQGGKLHDTMKALIPEAVIFGFTGTPLLKKDRNSFERFGRYVHTYKFAEAVRDAVVLDLVYEARDVDQVLGEQDHIDAWFEAKTKALNDWQKGELKKRWGTLQQVLSSRSRMERIVQDVVFDFATKPRLSSQRGNAMLVAGSIYEACRYYELFQKTELKGKCAVVTSYDPQAKDVSKEETGANTETDKQFVFNLYTSILKSVPVKAGRSKTEVYEDESKRRFVKEPATMKLLVVVDKLLTGFDAPPCTYLYIDKPMQDHGLFQAICRTNRLDGEDKKFGYVVDYRDLFKKLVNDEGTGALQVYSSELDHSAPGASPEVVMENRITKGKKQLDEALEALELLCGPVMPPREEKDFIRYFCGNTEKAGDLAEREPVRVALYKTVATFVRAYANLADELDRAGYSAAEIAWLKNKLDHYVKVRDVVRLAAGEVLDMKPYEADMRHLIDTYVEAKAPRKISPFENEGLLEVIAKVGVKEATKAKLGALGGDLEAIAETIENNVRAAISQQQLNDPAFYAKMSALLDEVIRIRKERAEEYERYLQEIATLVATLQAGHAAGLPKELDSPGKVALYNNLDGSTERALDVDRAVREARPDSWRGVAAREQMVKRAIFEALKQHGLAETDEVERVFAIVKAQKEYSSVAAGRSEASTRHTRHTRRAGEVVGGRSGVASAGEAPLDSVEASNARVGDVSAETSGEVLELNDVRIVVLRRPLKNVHLTVHPPDGRVQITAPEKHSLDALRAFAIGRLPWIRKQQRAMWAQPREPRREFLNRESHYLWGERYLLNVVEREAPPEVRVRPRELTLQVREGAGANAREAVLARWYRDQLRERVAKLLEVWAPKVGEWPAQVHVQRMKTKWASCHRGRRAIRLNTELAKKPPECLEYVLVHELVHLREANHGPRFQAILDEVMPMWREHRDALNDAPLAHVDWDY